MPQGALGVEPMCRLAGVSRAGFYRFLGERHPHEEEMEVRSAIQQIVVEHRRRYGYRRVTAELRRRGMAVNHKRVARLMAEDNLLCLRKRRFVATTDSGHDLRVYLNLAGRMELTGIDQLWVADITYIRLAEEFLFLAVVLDAFSRRVLGWALDERLDASLAVAALRQAIDLRQPAPGLVHHSDRGVQYACNAYVDLLLEHGIQPSMSRAATPTTTHAARASSRHSNRRRSIPGSIATGPIWRPTSASSSSAITIAGDCTRRSTTARPRRSSKACWPLRQQGRSQA